MKQLNKLVLAWCLFLLTSLSFAKGISINDPYVREVPPGQMNSATFLVLKNDSDKEIALIKANSDVAKNVELHEHVHKDGMMQMRQVQKITIPANGVTELKPGGYHIMLIGLTRQIKSGDIIDLNLEFDDDSKQAIKATVRKVMQGMMGKKMKGMKHGAMKIDKAHLNPMPNLMSVFKKTPEVLKLSPEQIEKIKAGIAQRSPKTKDLYQAVIKYEKEIMKAALADKSLTDIDQLANNIIQERLNIINTKAACAESLKSVMNKEQFAKLQNTYKTSYAKKLEYPDNMQGEMAMLKHVNPMPNLIMVVKKMGDKLKLNEKQVTKLKAWQDERDPVMSKQYKLIIKLENALQEAALNNAPPEKLSELADGIMQNRIKVIRGKAFSRDKIKQILKPEQYQKVLELYKANFL